jgi:uncharacterized protein
LDRVFLDANVLFSAAYAAGSCFLALWQSKGIRLLTSEYAVHEATRNLATAESLKRLDDLVGVMEIVPTHSTSVPPDEPLGGNLPTKDQPILLAAIDARATHLLTGDRRHFNACYGKRIRGVLVQQPAQYLRSKSRRSKGA